jgi:predicted helicase
LVICVSGVGARSGFSALVTDVPPNFHTLDTGQCFPLYLYPASKDDEKQEANVDTGLFGFCESETKVDAITDDGLLHFKNSYDVSDITKEDVFYYTYGILHSQEYREKYEDNLAKELPRIPVVKKVKDFWDFSNAGRRLAELHLGYENVKPYDVEIACTTRLTDEDVFTVEKMRYGRLSKEKDLTTVQYNSYITISKIPLEAYEYFVNGKPALDWVIERQSVRPDIDSGIVNDANLWAKETMGDAAYPLKLFQRVITVSLETMKIVKALPKLEIETN